MKDGFDYQCLCVLCQKMPSHKGLMILEWRGYLRQLFWVWGILNLCPTQPMINVKYQNIMFSTHHPKVEHISPMLFKWITEVVVQLCMGIIALDLLCMTCLNSHKVTWHTEGFSCGLRDCWLAWMFMGCTTTIHGFGKANATVLKKLRVFSSNLSWEWEYLQYHRCYP